MLHNVCVPAFCSHIYIIIYIVVVDCRRCFVGSLHRFVRKSLFFPTVVRQLLALFSKITPTSTCTIHKNMCRRPSAAPAVVTGILFTTQVALSVGDLGRACCPLKLCSLQGWYVEIIVVSVVCNCTHPILLNEHPYLHSISQIGHVQPFSPPQLHPSGTRCDRAWY